MLRYLANAIAQLPNAPAVYAIYGGRGRGLHVAYVDTRLLHICADETSGV
jgi:hypothetical protein